MYIDIERRFTAADKSKREFRLVMHVDRWRAMVVKAAALSR